MSIRHIVIWELVATDEASRIEALDETRRTLEPLVEGIPEVMSLTISPKVAGSGANGDLILESEFATLADLESYVVHPLHVAAALHLQPMFASRTIIDFTI